MTKFGSTYQTWSDSNVGLFDINTKARALEWINQLDAGMGGTEMQACLKHVLEDEKPDKEYKRQVLLITDAGIYDCRGITKLIKEHYENSPRNDGSVPNTEDPQNRFFVLGVGAGVSKSLCEDIAKAGGGIAAFCQADASVEEKTARLLAYAVRRPALAVRNEHFEVQFGDGLETEAEDGSPTGFPTNLFNGIAMGPTNSDLKEEVTHFKYGRVFDSVPENGINFTISARMNYTLNGRARSDDLQKEKHVRVESGRNPLYYAYVKDELNRLQTWLDEYGQTEQAASKKKTMIDLSTTTNLLCSLTAFIGVKSRSEQHRSDNSVMEVDRQQAAHLEDDNDMDIDLHIGTIMDQSNLAPAATGGGPVRRQGQRFSRKSSQRTPQPSGTAPRRIPSGIPAGTASANGHYPVGGRPPPGKAFYNGTLIDANRTDVNTVVDADSAKDNAIAELLKHIRMNGIVPRNEKTDSSLKILSGDMYDPNDQAKLDKFIEKLAEKLSPEQIETLKSNQDWPHTMAWIVFMLGYGLRKYQRLINKSMRILSNKIGGKPFDQMNLEQWAKNLTF